MNSKKLAALILAAAMLLSVLAGCGSSQTSAAPAESAAGAEALSAAEPAAAPDAQSADSFTVGICQLVQHDALDAATQGFQDRLTELMTQAGKTVTFDYQNASGDSANCSTIANQFVASGVDLILANATPALQACATATAASGIPVVATSITDFGVALGIDMGSTDATGINVTGSNDLAPLEQQAQQILDLFPETKTVGCIYCSSEANSLFQVEGVKAALEPQGVACNFYSFADSNDIQAVVKKAAEESDVIYIPTDNTAASNGAIIDDVCSAANTPIIAGEEGIFVNVNAVATLSLSFYQIGQVAGEYAFDILVNGKDPAAMNIYQTDQLTYYYNPTVAEKYGAIIPDGYEVYVAE